MTCLGQRAQRAISTGVEIAEVLYSGKSPLLPRSPLQSCEYTKAYLLREQTHGEKHLHPSEAPDHRNHSVSVESGKQSCKQLDSLHS